MGEGIRGKAPSFARPFDRLRVSGGVDSGFRRNDGRGRAALG